jgi:arginase family enzyme
MDRVVANRFDLRWSGSECILRPHGTATEIRAASRLVDLLKRAELPLDREETAAALNVDVHVVNSLCKNCLLVPENIAPLLAQDFFPKASAEELHRFLWAAAKQRVAIVDVPCDFVDGSDAHRDTGVRQLMKAVRNNLAPLRAAPEAGKQFLDYEFGRIYTVDHSAVCHLGTLRQALATEARGSVMARLELLAGAAAASRLALVTVAGDHSVTYELFRTLSSVHGPLQLVHFDAHCDQYHSLRGIDELNHANVIAKVLGDLPVVRSVHIGLREGHLVPAHVSMHTADSMRVFSARDVERLNAVDVLGSLDPMVPTYISFDADVLDPTVAPETGHPVPGGISYLKAAELMDLLACSYSVIGADFVEVAGATTQTNNAAQTVAAVMRRLLLGAFTFEASPMNVHLRDTHAAR